jgi:hypothetical protein
LPRKLRSGPRLALAISGLCLFAALAWASLSRTQPTVLESREKKPETDLLHRLRTARPGRPVLLVGPDLPPRWSKIVLGEDAAKLIARKGELLWLNTPAICLLEVVPPDPGRGDYRLTVELAQTDGEAVSQAGLYAGREEVPFAGGVGQCLLQATYCERSFEEPNARDDPFLILGIGYLRELKIGAIHPHRMQLPGSIRLPSSTRTRDGQPYRTVVLEVRKDGTGIGSTNRPSSMTTHARQLFLYQFFRRKLPDLKNHQPGFSPAGGAGLAVFRGAIVVRRLLFEPLPVRR